MALTQIPQGMLSSDLQNSTPAFKNRIINGGMRIDQRNNGASLTMTDTANGHYTLDRWLCGGTQASKYSIQRNVNSVTPPPGFTNYLGITSLSAYSIIAGDIFSIQQRIEGYNIADLMWGTSNAKSATLSFWVRSSLTGIFTGSIRSGGFDRALPYSYTINNANTWEYKTVSFTGCTDGTWDNTNGSGGAVLFCIASGSNFQSAPGTWNTGGGLCATGQVNLLGTSGATLYITGVQLEVGTTATNFDTRNITQELLLCQRYYFTAGGSIRLYTDNTGSYCSTVPPVTPRSTPTMTLPTPGTGNGILVVGANGTNGVYTLIKTSSGTYLANADSYTLAGSAEL